MARLIYSMIFSYQASILKDIIDSHFSYFSIKAYVVVIQKNHLNETVKVVVFNKNHLNETVWTE